MSELLDLGIAAHGGASRWSEISRFTATASFTGALWAQRGRPGLFDDVTLEGSSREQRLIIRPFAGQGRRVVWSPTQVRIEAVDGGVISARPDPDGAAPEDLAAEQWDELQAAHFAAQSAWSRLNAPFLFAQPGFTTLESAPRDEEGSVWRSLEVEYPPHISAPARHETVYFDEAGIMRRLDYSVPAIGGENVVTFLSAHRCFDGILVPRRRRVYVRGDDGAPIPGSVTVAVDISEIHFT